MRRIVVVALAIVTIAGIASAAERSGHGDLDPARPACAQLRAALLAAPGRHGADVKLENLTLTAATSAGPGLIECAFRAEVKNDGRASALDGLAVTARLTSRSSALRILDESLTFGIVPAGARALSLATLRVQLDLHRPLRPNQLAWTISAAPELAVPAGWVGAWRVAITYRKPSGAVIAVEETEGAIHPGQALGLSIAGPLATCTAGMTDSRLTVLCTLNALPAMPCAISGSLDLVVDRTGDGLTGTGAWTIAGPGCVPAVSGGQIITIAGTRLDVDPGPSSALPSTLLRRFASQPLVMAPGP